MRGEEKEEILQIHPIFLLRRRRGGGSDHSKRKVKSTEAGRCPLVPPTTSPLVLGIFTSITSFLNVQIE